MSDQSSESPTGVVWDSDGWTGAGLPPSPAREPGGPERLLAETARRALRSPGGRMALVLHLSRLAPPAPRPHHRRVARAILDEAAQRNEGQVFALSSGDFVLLCRRPSHLPLAPRIGPALARPDPVTLPLTLGRLLRIDAPDPSRLTTLWRLDEEPRALIAYAAEQLSAFESGESAVSATSASPPVPSRQTATLGALAALAETAPAADLLHRQTAVLLAEGMNLESQATLRPLLRELIFSPDVLQARLPNGDEATADPFLSRHLCARIDRRVLEMLLTAIGRGGPMDIAAHGGLPVHLNLSLPTILSEAFVALAAMAAEVGAPLGIEVSFVEAVGDLAAFARARRLLGDKGIALVLDGVSHLALTLTRPWRLGADLLKLEWAPRLADLPQEELPVLAAALERIDTQRLVLAGTDGEAAMRWGLAHGIRRFQGNHVDALLAAARMLTCPHLRTAPAACTMRLCMGRAAAPDAAGRDACARPGMLEGGQPTSLSVGRAA